MIVNGPTPPKVVWGWTLTLAVVVVLTVLAVLLFSS